jgi:hypothetical protein
MPGEIKMEWSEYKETKKFKRLEAEAIELSNRIDEIYREIEKDCPIPMVGNDRTHYYSLSIRNKCLSRYHVMGHIVGND